MYNRITIFLSRLLCKHDYVIIMGRYNPYFKTYRCTKCDKHRERYKVPPTKK